MFYSNIIFCHQWYMGLCYPLYHKLFYRDFFFIKYGATPWPTLGQCRGDSFPDQKLIIEISFTTLKTNLQKYEIFEWKYLLNLRSFQKVLFYLK